MVSPGTLAVCLIYFLFQGIHSDKHVHVDVGLPYIKFSHGKMLLDGCNIIDFTFCPNIDCFISSLVVCLLDYSGLKNVDFFLVGKATDIFTLWINNLICFAIHVTVLMVL